MTSALPGFWRPAVLLAAVFFSAVVVLLAFPAAGHGFLEWEDSAYIVGNPLVSEGFSLATALQSLFGSHEANWIPFSWITMSLETTLSGGSPSPRIFHLVSLAAHALAGVLLWQLLRRIAGITAASLAALLFLIHPQRVESVAWASAQKELFACLSVLIAAWCYALSFDANPRQQSAWRSAAWLAFTVSLLFKSSGIAIPAVLLVIERARGATWKQSALRSAPFLAASLVVGLITWRVNTSVEMLFDPTAATWGQRISQSFAVVCSQLRAFAYPLQLAPELGRPVPMWPWSFGGLLVVAWVVAAALPKLAQPVGLRSALWLPWLAWLLLLAPFSGIVPTPMAFTSDRVHHLPSVALSFAAAMLLERMLRRGRAARVATVVTACSALAACIWMSRQQAQVWQDDATLFAHIARLHPEHAVARVNRGVMALRNGDRALSEEEFLRATRGDRPMFSAWKNLLLLQNHERKFSDALKTAEGFTTAFPQRAESWYLRGLAELEAGEASLALETLETARTLRPDSEKILAAIHTCREALGYPAEPLPKVEP